MTPAEDPSIGTWIVGIVTAISGAVGLSKLLGLLATKSSVERHKKAQDEQNDKTHTAILDLYGKNDDRRAQIEDLATAMHSGFADVNAKVADMHVDLLKELRARK